MARKAKHIPKPFESMGNSSDTFAGIFMSMLISPAWKALSANQQRLYLYCKAQYYGEKRKPRDNVLYFTMNQHKWADIYDLYSRSNDVGFRRDMSALIDHGFVKCVECGAHTRTKTIYSFSDMWRHYGTKFFELSPSDKTEAMLNKERRERM